MSTGVSTENVLARIQEGLAELGELAGDPEALGSAAAAFTQAGGSLRQIGADTATGATSRLTTSEARMLDDLGLLGVKDAHDTQISAENTAKTTFGGAGIVDGHADAFRHAYWNALLTQRFDEGWTSDFTTTHERRPDNFPMLKRWICTTMRLAVASRPRTPMRAKRSWRKWWNRLCATATPS